MTPDFLQSFRIEAHDNLTDIEKSALLLEANLATADCTQTLNEIFRGFHNIKGSAGMFKLKPLTDFTHKVENLLDLARDRELPVSVELVEIILGAADYVKELLENHEAETQPPAKLVARIDRLSAVAVR